MDIFQEYENYDALGLAELVAKGDVSAEELLEAAIERVERYNPSLNAVVTKMYDQARASIAAGLPQGPLKGVPFLLKDSLNSILSIVAFKSKDLDPAHDEV